MSTLSDLPLISNDPDSLYQPRTFIETWALAISIIQQNAGSGSGYNATIDGVGRVAGADYFTTDSGQPATPPSPALAVRIKAGVWYVQGQRIEIDTAFSLLGVPASFPEGIYGYASVRDLGEGVLTLEVLEENWSEALQPDLTASGLACLGLIKTDAEQVTSVLPDGADVIVPNPVMQARLKSLNDRLMLLENGGGGDGGGGGYAYVGSAPWLASPGDSRATQVVVNELLDARDAELTALINAGGARPRATPLDAVVLDNAINRDSSIALLPSDGERHDAAFGVKTTEGIFGNGSNGHPTYFRTDLDVDPETGEITP